MSGTAEGTPSVLDGVALVRGTPETAWKRPLVTPELADAAGCATLWLVLHEGGADIDGLATSPHSDKDRYWWEADRVLNRAHLHLEDVRDDAGALVEVTGPVAPALVSKKFRTAALARLGARQAWVSSSDGVELRLRDAWRAHPVADIAVLSEGSVLGDVVLLIDASGVLGVVMDDVVVAPDGRRTEVIDGDTSGPDRDQVVFARALLTFLGGLVLALGFAVVLAMR